MNKSIFMLIIAVLSCSSLNAKSLCLKGEEIYFSCQTGKKEISFCGKTNKFLEYRFGKPKKLKCHIGLIIVKTEIIKLIR